MLILPIFSYAQNGLVACGRTLQTAVTAPDGTRYQAGQVVPCDFNDFLALVNRVIRFILFNLAVPIAAIMFFYAGFKLVTSGGSTEARTQAKSVFAHTAFGLFFIAGAWLIIRTILSILGYQGAWIGF